MEKFNEEKPILEMTDPLITKLGTEVPLDARAILYLCELTKRPELRLKVRAEGIFKSQSAGLEAYANIHNPESQLVLGNTFDELIKELIKLHKNMENPKWLSVLEESI